MTNSYFVFFKTQRAAAAAAQCSIFPEGAQDAFQVFGAPGPEEVRALLPWQALSLQRNACFAGRRPEMRGTPVLVCSCLFTGCVVSHKSKTSLQVVPPATHQTVTPRR